MNLLRVGIMSAVCVGLLSITASAAFAGTEIQGYLARDGRLVKFDTFRYHDANAYSDAGIWLGDSVDSWSRFGLRNTSGTQVTASVQFARQDYGWRSWGYLKSGRFALNGRMGSISGGDNSFSGELMV